jgi:hypothetical protein
MNYAPALDARRSALQPGEFGNVLLLCHKLRRANLAEKARRFDLISVMLYMSRNLEDNSHVVMLKRSQAPFAELRSEASRGQQEACAIPLRG